MDQSTGSDRLRPDRGEQESLRCEVVSRRDTVWVRTLGAIGLDTVAVLEDQLVELREAGFRRLVFNLGGLSFMDSTGLRLFLR